MAVSYTGQIVREAPEVEAQKAAVIKAATTEYNKKYTMPAYVAAGLSPTQLQAMSLAQQGIGVYEPYLTAASNAITQGQDLAMLGAQDIYGLNLDPQYQAAMNAYDRGLISANQLNQYQQNIAAGNQYIQRGAGVVGQAANMADNFLQANLSNARNYIGQGAGRVLGATPNFAAAEQATGKLGTYAQQAGRGAGDVAGGIAGINQAQQMIRGQQEADLGASQAAIRQGISATLQSDADFTDAERAAQGIGRYTAAANSGLGAVSQGTRGLGQAAQAAGQYTEADLGASEAALRQGLSAARQVDADFSAAERVANQLGGYANAADQGLGTIQRGVRGMTSAAQDIGDYAQADLGRSQALINQAARQTQEADVNMGLANRAVRSGIQTAENVAEAAMPAQRQAARTINLGIEGLLQGAEEYSPDAAQEFMNPYQRAVTQQAMQEMRRQGNIARQEMAAQAVRAGAFGGTREGVQRAEFERNLQDQMQQKILQDYFQNYTQAQQAAMTGFEQQQQRQLSQGSALGQLGLSQSEIGQRSAEALAKEAALQGTLGTQAGALQTAEAQNELAQAAQLAQTGQALGQQELQQAQLGQQAETSEGAIYQNLVQAGLAPAQIAQVQSQIQAQRAGLLTDAQSRELQAELQRAQQITQSGQAMGQQAIQQAQLGQAGTGLQANIYQNLVQAGYTPAQIAQVQGQMQAQQAGLLTDVQSRELQAELSRAQQLVQSGQILGQQEIQQTQLGQSAAQALAGMSAQEAQAGTLYGQIAGQQANITNQQAQNLANMQTQKSQLGLQQGQQLANIGQQLGAQEIQQMQLGQQGIQNMAAAGQALGQMGLQQGQLGTAQGQLATQQAQLYGQLGQGIGSLAGQQAQTALAQGQALGQAGQQIASMGIQQGAVGQQAQTAAQADVGLLYNLGVGEQQNAQAQLDAIRATAAQKALQAKQNISWLSDITRGAPSTQMSLSSQTVPAGSVLQTMAGIGSGLLAGGAAAKSAGLI